MQAEGELAWRWNTEKSAESAGSSGKTCSSIGDAFQTAEIIASTEYGSEVKIQSFPKDSFCGSGQAVNLLTVTRADGFQVQFEISANVRINENEQGKLTFFFPDSGRTKSFDKEGNLFIEKEEDFSDELGTDGNDIIINVNKNYIDGKEGDDTIINLTNNALIKTGGGEDKVYLSSYQDNITIDTESGSNHIYGKDILNSSIMGDGHIYIESNTLNNVSLNTTGSLNIDSNSLIKSNISNKGELFLNTNYIDNSTMKQSGSANIRSGGVNNSTINQSGDSNIRAYP